MGEVTPEQVPAPRLWTETKAEGAQTAPPFQNLFAPRTIDIWTEFIAAEDTLALASLRSCWYSAGLCLFSRGTSEI